MKTTDPESVAELARLGFLKARGTDLIIDRENKKVFQLLCWYFARDEKFNEAGFDLRKNIFLRGDIGCGKTSLMRAFAASNPLSIFAIMPTRMVTEFYQRGGMDGTKEFFGVNQLLEDPAYYCHNKSTLQGIGICFDDLGTEPQEVKYFGSSLPLMCNILQDCYDEYCEGYRYRTHITSNLNFDGIEGLYGPRVRSRMAEMFNIINFPNKTTDRRKATVDK